MSHVQGAARLVGAGHLKKVAEPGPETVSGKSPAARRVSNKLGFGNALASSKL